MDLNPFEIERQMLAGVAETERRARLAWRGKDRFAPRPARGLAVRRARRAALLALGGLVESAGWMLLRWSAG